MNKMNRVVSYSIGLLLALCLTLEAFSTVSAHTLPTPILIAAILLLAMVQLSVQLVFFLHLGQDKESQWNTAMFFFTFFGILTVILSSLWIMNHLNNNMTPMQVEQYINNQSSF